MRAVIVDHATLAPSDLVLDSLWALPFDWKVFDDTDASQILSHIGDADVVLANKVVLDAGIIGACPNLKLIIIMATGTNNVDLAAARQRGVAVSNIVNYSTESVVQHTFALLLALATRLLQYHTDVAAGRWQTSRHFGLFDHPVLELHGKTLGIVGYGAIGKRVAEVAQALGMHVLLAHSGAAASNEGRLPLPELFAASDVVSLHCPLTARNRQMINAETLRYFKPGALLINVSRGALIDEQALAQALRSGLLGGAGIDVLSEEPPVHGSPLLQADVPNIIVTPHSAWVSREARQTMVNQAAQILAAFISGRRVNQVE
jgi:glycerate dehydrogenase